MTIIRKSVSHTEQIVNGYSVRHTSGTDVWRVEHPITDKVYGRLHSLYEAKKFARKSEPLKPSKEKYYTIGRSGDTLMVANFLTKNGYKMFREYTDDPFTNKVSFEEDGYLALLKQDWFLKSELEIIKCNPENE